MQSMGRVRKLERWLSARLLVYRGVMLGRILLGILSLSLIPDGAFAAKSCTLGKLAELPVTMVGLRPVVAARINGSEVRFLADSGAFWSMISPASANEFKLPLRQPSFHLTLEGIGGTAAVSVTTVKEFTLSGIPLKRIDFIVGGSDPEDGIAGILGQNVLRIADVEYDLANGVIRLMRPRDCSSANLVYWGAEAQAYSAMEIDWATAAEPHTTGVAYLNGARIRVMFDTGSATSMLTLHAAERAGIKTDSPGVTPAGKYHGIGRNYVSTWLAPIQSFKIGEEEIRNTRLRLGDLRLGNIDMLIGADFFLSHRVYVASSQRKLYFTYNGGPVFNLKTAAAAEEPTHDGGTQTLDAEGFARRGAASAARHEYDQAIADLTHAVELAPQEPGYLYQRAQAYAGNKQFDLARTDLEQVLKLKPDDVNALAVRAELRLATRDRTGALADLDAADHAAPPQADIRLVLGNLYLRANQPPQAVLQYTQWIDAHDNDVRQSDAYGARCWARAISGQELDQGLSDCNNANRLSSNNARVLSSRGTLRLRLGEYDRALEDFEASLKVDPKNPWALYGRGQAELHKKKNAAAESDLAAATALAPHIADEFRRRGLEAPAGKAN
jgi:tetratricopeptide (TPR) repeat protein/predicted aspartyl protease